jgi:hypothetical protein
LQPLTIINKLADKIFRLLLFEKKIRTKNEKKLHKKLKNNIFIGTKNKKDKFILLSLGCMSSEVMGQD